MKRTLSKAMQLAPFLTIYIGAMGLHMFSEIENFSQRFKSTIPSWPPKAYMLESVMLKHDGKNARFVDIGGLSVNFWYLLKNKFLLEKLLSTSLPPKINKPSDFGRWTIELKKRNFVDGYTLSSIIHFLLNTSNLKISKEPHLGQKMFTGDGVVWYICCIYINLSYA